MRKRIREDLREAIASHDDYADSNLPSLKRIYLRKSQEAEVRLPPIIARLGCVFLCLSSHW